MRRLLKALVLLPLLLAGLVGAQLAVEHSCETIAFPLVSSGIYGYPKDEASHVATSAISEFLDSHDISVYLAVFDKAAVEVSEELLGDVQSLLGGQ
jgi:O-acetyl-ADP-ribose deacetylase (regulator of RNase III)